jgi:hypothetical protein
MARDGGGPDAVAVYGILSGEHRVVMEDAASTKSTVCGVLWEEKAGLEGVCHSFLLHDI